MKLYLYLVAILGASMAPAAAEPEHCYPESLDLPSPDCEERTVKQDVEGLWTNPNPIGMQIPQGALKRADNVTVDRPGVATSVRGMVRDTYALPGGVTPRQIFEYSGLLYVWGSDGVLYKDTGAAYVSVGSAPANGASRLRNASGGGDLYVTSADGVLLQDTPNGLLQTPGAPRALDPDPEATFPMQIVDGLLAVGEAVAYRLVIGYNDAEGRPVLGEPSGRFVFVNTSVNRANPRTGWILPPGVTTSHFAQLYRTTIVSAAEIAAGGGPGERFEQVAERTITGSEIMDGTIAFTDTTPDLFLQAPLYTNPDQGGQRNANVRPPLAADVTTFRNRLWAANTRAATVLAVRLLGLPVVGNVLTIAGLTYAAVSDPADAGYGFDNGAFIVYTTGTTAQNIQRTAVSLVRAINKRVGNTSVRAFYVSGAYDSPGQIRIEGVAANTPTFSMVASANGSQWVPDLSSPAESFADVYPNRLHYSKDGIFYGFPLGNTLAVGAEEQEIMRIIPLRESLFVFKRGDGLWKVQGVGPFYVDQVNSTVRLLSPDAIAVVDNTIFAVTDEGVVAVTESAVDVVSVPVDNLFRELIVNPTTRGLVEDYAFAVARDAATEKKVYFWLPEGPGSTGATQALVWNQVTQTWTRRTEAAQAGFVTSEGQLVLGTVGPILLLERRTGSNQDYLGATLTQALDVLGVSGNWVTIDADMTDWAPGQVVSGTTGNDFHRILEVDAGANRVRVADPGAFAAGFSTQLYERLPIAVEWNTETAASPNTLKQFYEATVLLEQKHTAPFPTTFTGDGGESDWGPVQSEAEGEPYVRAEVPFDTQQTSRLGVRVEHDVCAQPVNIVGMSTRFRPLSSTLTR